MKTFVLLTLFATVNVCICATWERQNEEFERMQNAPLPEIDEPKNVAGELTPDAEEEEEEEIELPGALSDAEKDSCLSSHNKIRTSGDLQELSWSDEIESNTKLLVHCTVEFPGPPVSFTNFGKFKSSPESLIEEWGKEAENVQDNALDAGCRTAQYGVQKCNHKTNMMRPQLRHMACSARDCDEGERQLVCVYVDYDNLYSSYSYGWYRR